VQVTTDNKTRAAKDVRSAFAKHEGNLASSGAVAFQFQHAGQFLIAPEKTTEDALMEIALEAGADDVVTSEQGFEVRCNVHAFDKVAHALEQKGIKPDSAEIAYIPTTTVPVKDVNIARTVTKLTEALEEFDDVQAVYSNEEIDDTIAALI
jgi:transcriptional/translational regulatory protein YebC/TACO1